jgi:hypothetical protein
MSKTFKRKPCKNTRSIILFLVIRQAVEYGERERHFPVNAFAIRSNGAAHN